MSVRTIIEIERCKSSPRFETVATIVRELNISLDAVVFQNIQTDSGGRFLLWKERNGSSKIYHSVSTS